MSQDNNSLIYNWSVQEYIDLVENSSNELLKEYEKIELDYITSKISRIFAKTIIDVGAGYGRLLPHISSIVKNVIAIEIDNTMLKELKKRASKYQNLQVIHGDANTLTKLLSGLEIQYPVLLSLQNSLGTWLGDSKIALSQMRKIAEEKHGEIIISLLRATGFKIYGLDMYKSLEKLVGEIDLEKTDIENGIFRSKTGYLSKWRSDREIKEIKKQLGGQIINNIEHPGFVIFHIGY